MNKSTIKRIVLAVTAISGVGAIIGGISYLNSGYTGANIFESLICIGIFLTGGLLFGLGTEFI